MWKMAKQSLIAAVLMPAVAVGGVMEKESGRKETLVVGDCRLVEHEDCMMVGEG